MRQRKEILGQSSRYVSPSHTDVYDRRLINHCCAPNCNARIITIMGEKKIVIYAKTNIEAGDEVTYGPSFPSLFLCIR